MARNDPLAGQIRAVQLTDAEMRRIARIAALEAERIAKSASELRGAQLRLAAINTDMWAKVRDAAEVGIGDGVFTALEQSALFDEDLMARAGVSPRYWKAQQLATANAGIQALVGRKENGITLSQRVWRNSQVARRGLDDTINVGLALGKSQVEIARDVRKYISPDVPGGASYAAMRLGRSEVLNAYHTTAVNKYKETPWVDRVKWNLSGSHPRPDQCNEYAEQGNLKGGYWSPDQVPAKPHPNCLCFVTPSPPSLDEYVRRFESGEFDDYIERQMGCVRT